MDILHPLCYTTFASAVFAVYRIVFGAYHMYRRFGGFFCNFYIKPLYLVLIYAIIQKTKEVGN